MDHSATATHPTTPPPVDEDLFCLTCTYNLRGLSGDPVRCPECGDAHDRKLLRAPAWAVRLAVGRMETAPTTCVAIAAAAALCFGTALFLDGPGQGSPTTILRAAVLGAFLLACWPIAFWRVRTAFSAQPGWTSIVAGFHLSAGLCTLWYPMSLAFMLANYNTRISFPRGTGWVVFALSVGAAWAGLRVYGRARRRLAVLRKGGILRVVHEVTHARKSEPRTFRPGR